MNLKRCLLSILFLGYSISSVAQTNPSANQASIKKLKDVRFTVLTPRVIRMEWDSTNTFTDNRSFTIVNRNLPTPKYTAKQKNGWYIIQTDELELKYHLNSGKFSALNLSIRYRKDNSQAFTWKPGMVQKENLKGTARTLDRFNGDTDNKGQKMKLEEGILSRDGWFLLDDSDSFLFDNSDWPWVARRSSAPQQDWYFMGYGLDYKSALSDYTKIAGKVPLPPRYAFGYWWSRYWSYSDNELRDLVKNFEKFNVPLDVLVIDMDWHTTDSVGTKPDEFGQRKWWTGWTWNKALFSDPEKFLQWTKTRKLKTTLNLHPASGIAPWEERYGEFARKMDFDPTSRKNIPFLGSDKQFMNNLFDVVLSPLEKQGVDFWWLDWQQWLEDKKIKGLQNTWWLNYTFFTQMERNRDTRPLLYHRWGGLGNHRYQIGFSGDAYISWKSLEYQPYFTNTASNVLYGYWSHDIGGHTFGGAKRDFDPELYTRWMQYGALSPIFRTHSAKNATLNKEIWNFRGDFFTAQHDAIRLRYTLAPYIYTMARKTYDTGISLCRPMYYDYPEKDEAYRFDRQYMFGDDILVAPIGTPTINGFSKIKVWLPGGNDWYEWHTGTILAGGRVIERDFAIDEYPIFVKAGAIIPMYGNEVMNLEENPDRLKLGIFPGGVSSGQLYEDQGNTKDYVSNCAYTGFKTRRLSDHSLEIILEPVKDTYPGMKNKKDYLITLFGSAMPESVTVNGEEVNWQGTDQGNFWDYNGDELSANLHIAKVDVDRKLTVLVNFGRNKDVELNTGLRGKFKRLSRATNDLKYKVSTLVLPKTVGTAVETNRKLAYDPKNFSQIIKQFNINYSRIPESIKALNLNKDIENWYLRYLGF